MMNPSMFGTFVPIDVNAQRRAAVMSLVYGGTLTVYRAGRNLFHSQFFMM